jgi:Protein of unknown function (DUF742)
MDMAPRPEPAHPAARPPEAAFGSVLDVPPLITRLPSRPDDEDDTAPAAVRGYAWTRGRTTPQYRLEIETLLSTTDRYQAQDESTPTEFHSVAALCHQPASVAEVAAMLRLPLGIAKVLAGDMAATGLLAVHDTASVDGDGPDLMLMERILGGLRRL